MPKRTIVQEYTSVYLNITVDLTRNIYNCLLVVTFAWNFSFVLYHLTDERTFFFFERERERERERE